MINVRTRDNSGAQGKRRVFVVCHPADAGKWFDRICEDIFRTHDCAIFYFDENQDDDDENLETDLGRADLFVFPVTWKHLSEPNFARDTVLPFALDNRIYVLPIMLEPSLDEAYSKIFGELQYLDIGNSRLTGGNSIDPTAISYEDKLRKYLEAVLISDELAQKVRDAFDAYVFLSYRKKDRKYANELMKLIHKNRNCWNIAIWYDEFLTPGESFNDSIRDALNRSELFTMLVTPNLVNEENYVKNIEYPAACDANKAVLPVEMVETDRSQLEKQFSGIPDCVKNENEDEFRERLITNLSKLAKYDFDDDTEHKYLLGLAYVEGIDVEKNVRRGEFLIKSAAEEGLLEAIDYRINKMREIPGVFDDLNDNRTEYMKLAEKSVEIVSKEKPEDDPELLDRMMILAEACNMRLNEYAPRAREISQKVYDIRKKNLGETHPKTLESLKEIAHSYENSKESSKALEIYKELHEKSKRALGEKDPQTLSILYRMALTYYDMGKSEPAFATEKEVYEAYKEILGKSHLCTLDVLESMSASCAEEDIPAIYEGLEEAEEEIFKDRPFDICKRLQKIIGIYMDLEEDEKCLELNEKLFEIEKEEYGLDHTATQVTAQMLAMYYRDLGETDKEKEMLKIGFPDMAPFTDW